MYEIQWSGTAQCVYPCWLDIITYDKISQAFLHLAGSGEGLGTSLFCLPLFMSWMMSKLSYAHTYGYWQGAGCTPTWGSDTYVPPIQAFCYILQYSVSFFWIKWTPVDKLTQNLGFNIPFHLYIHDHDSEWAGVPLLEGQTCTYPQYRHFVTYYGIRLAFLAQMDTSWQTNSKSWF